MTVPFKMPGLAAFVTRLWAGTCDSMACAGVEGCLVRLDGFVGPAGGEDPLQALALVLWLPQISLCDLIPHVEHDDGLDHLFLSVDEAAGAVLGPAAFGKVTQRCLGSHSCFKIVYGFIFILY